MRVIVLSSGRKGNTTYIESNEAKILIDAGNTAKYINECLSEIGVNSEDIDAILITHTHVDHIGGLKSFLKKSNACVYIMPGMVNELNYIKNYKIIENDEFNIKDLVIKRINTSHDAIDSGGYIVTCNNKSLVYITDTGYINKKYFEVLSNRELYIMESNHDIEMLNNSSYPFRIRQRILSDKGHLSNYDSAKYLSSFIGKKTKYIILAHLSQENNTEELAYNTLMERLKKENISFKNIYISKQNEKTNLIEI